MKARKIFLILIILLGSFQVGFGQEKPKAKLIQELGSVGGCENYWASLNSLFTELLNETDSAGYVVIQGNQDIVIQTIIYKEWAFNHLKFRKFDERLKTLAENRLMVVKGEDSAELRIKLWIIPNGAEKPFKFSEIFDYSLKLKKPLIIFDSNFDGGGLCPAINQTKVFSDFLKENADLSGNVVFYESSKGKFLERKKDFLKGIGNVPQNRLRFFRSPNGYEGNYEFWLVPQKMRLSANLEKSTKKI